MHYDSLSSKKQETCRSRDFNPPIPQDIDPISNCMGHNWNSSNWEEADTVK